MEKYLEHGDYTVAGELTVTITLAEYRELLRISTLYEQERLAGPRPVSLDNTREVE